MINFIRIRSAIYRIQCKRSIIILSLLWLIGFILGFCFTLFSGDLLSSYIFEAAHNTNALIGVFIIPLLPVSISAVSIYFSKPLIIYIYCIYKSVSYACCLFGTISAFGFSAWLVCLLLLFSDICVVVLMLWFWYRFFQSNDCNLRKDLLIYAAASVVACLIDYLLVSPYLAMLLNY